MNNFLHSGRTWISIPGSFSCGKPEQRSNDQRSLDHGLDPHHLTLERPQSSRKGQEQEGPEKVEKIKNGQKSWPKRLN